MDEYEYMKMPLKQFPEHTIKQYDLRKHTKNGYVYLEIRRAIYGLPQAGRLANQQLKKFLKPHGYYEVGHTPGVWRHKTRPISFTLVVDDFGINYVGEEHVQHLLSILQAHYPAVSTDWRGGLYIGITLKWNYEKGYVDISMPGYIKRILAKFKNEMPRKPQYSPYPAQPRKFGKAAQEPMSEDTMPKADEKARKLVQQVVGSILYYGRGVDLTTLVSLSTLASEQAKAMEQTITNMEQLLDYLATNPEATIRYYASDMILNIHSDASYLSERNARSRAAGHHFLGWLPNANDPIKLNGAIYTLCTILKFVAASAAEAELGALFLNMKQGRIIRLTLEEMGHPQPPTPIHCDNATTSGIVNGTIKRQRSRSMEMKYFYAADQVENKQFKVEWHPGGENLGDYPSKHHEAKHH